MVFVVAYLYNDNGMAAWVNETAKALSLRGHEVYLVHSGRVEKARLPTFCQLVEFDMPETTPSFIDKLLFHVKRLYNKRFGFSYHLSLQLDKLEIKPDAILLNQSNLIDTRTTIHQYIKASTYPATLITYLDSVRLSTNFAKLNWKNFINHIVEVIGWYFTDWYGYRHADVVMCHTDKLAESLKKRGINAIALPPPINIHPEMPRTKHERTTFITVTLNLNDTRKRIEWLLSVFSKLKQDNIEFKIIGNDPERLEYKYSDDSRIKFLGKLTREEVYLEYAKADIFLFASLSDTWGYVLTEAMSKGLAVFAPDIYPFDYIIGNNEFLYDAESENDLISKINDLVNGQCIDRAKHIFYGRAIEKFSGDSFASTIEGITKRRH